MSGGGRITVFAVGEVEYAVTGRIPRSLPAPAPLPSVVRHGEVDFPVVDLPAAVGAGRAAGSEPLLFLVEEGAVRRALLVERLVGAETADLEAVQPVPALYPETERRRWRGLLPRPDGRIIVLLRLEGLPVAGGNSAGGNSAGAKG